MRQRPAAAALLALTLGACSSGTFVVLDFPSGPAGAASIHASLSLDGKTADATYNVSGGITFPTSATLQIGTGAGDLVVNATVLDQAGKTLATAMAMVKVEQNKTVHLSIPFATTQVGDDLGLQTGPLMIAPLSNDFGTIVVGGSSAAKRFTVTNTGTATSGPLMVLIAGMDAADFKVIAPTPCLGMALTPNGSCTVDVQLAPMSTAIEKNALLRVLAPDGTPGGATSALLKGKAGAKGSLDWSEATHTFPNTLLGAAAGDTVFTLTNNGMGATSTIAVALSGSDAGDFEKVAGEDQCDGKTLAGNSSCTVKVRVKPTKRGPLAATLSADATTGGLATVTLGASGLIAAKLTFTGTAPMASPFNFGTVDVGVNGSTHHMFTIKNDGDTPAGQLTFVGVPSLGDLQPGAGLTCNDSTSPMPTILNPGDSCTADIVLKPSSFGTKNVQLTVSASPGGSGTTYVTGVGHDQVTILVSNASADGSSGVIGDSAMPHNFNCGGGNNVCSKTFDRTTSSVPVTFIATPDAPSYSSFLRWNQPGMPSCAGGQLNPTCDLLLDPSVPAGAYAFTASYKKQQFNLNYQRRDFVFGPSGAIGSMTIGGIPVGTFCNGPCSSGGTPIVVDGGTVVTVNASFAAANPSLRRIRGVTCTSGTPYSVNATSASCTFTMTADVNLDVTYSAHNYAFVTSQNYNGALAGLGGADNLCHTAASVVGLPGNYIALLSDSTTNARDRVPNGANGWVRIDGLPFAQDKTTLFGQLGGVQPNANWRLYYPLVVDEAGTTRNGAGDHARTYSGWDGQRKTALMPGDTNHCSNWNSSVDPIGDMGAPVQYSGTPSAGNFNWIDGSTLFGSGCNTQMRLYCVGTDLNVPVAPPPAPAGANRRIFLSAATFTPAPGKTRGDMDASCQAEGLAAFSGTTWKAFVATNATAAASQTGFGIYAFIRPDNVRVTDRAGLIGNAPNLAASITQYASGQYLNAISGTDLQVWGGGPSPAAAGSAGQTCSDWANSSATGNVGFSPETTPSFFNYFTTSCATARHFYCVEQ